MDQIKIGQFIATERKSKNYTQKELAEKIGISDKTVSKWERGNGFPEVSLLLPLCNELNITVNELLSGERLEEKEYKERAEENMMKMMKESEESKKRIILSAIVALIMLLSVVPLFLMAGLLKISLGLRVTLIGLGLIIIVLSITVSAILDRNAGAYECPCCHKRFVPSYYEYIMGAHTITKRKLKCPYCGEKRYCKHVLTK